MIILCKIRYGMSFLAGIQLLTDAPDGQLGHLEQLLYLIETNVLKKFHTPGVPTILIVLRSKLSLSSKYDPSWCVFFLYCIEINGCNTHFQSNKSNSVLVQFWLLSCHTNCNKIHISAQIEQNGPWSFH